jgi:preprotein translocase subunit SecG
MANVNTGLNRDDVQMRPTEEKAGSSAKLTGSSSSSEGKFSIRTQLEKILLIVAVILFILCIVFIALLAKETSKNDDSGSASRGGSKGDSGQCRL